MAESLQKTISKGMLWNSAGTILIKIAGLASVFLILHRLSIYEYGLLEIMMTVISFFSIFLLPGLGDVVIADMGIERGKGNLGGVKRILWQFFKLQAVLAIIAWAVFFFGANLIAHYYNPYISIYLKIASFSFLVSPLRSLFTTLFSVNFEFFNQSLYSLIEELLKIILVAVMFFVFNLNGEGVVLARVLAEFLSVACMLPLLLRTYKPLRTVALDKIDSMWNLLRYHGKWSLLSRYLDTFGKNMRVVIIKFMLGTEAVGLFAVAEGLINHTTALLPLNRIVGTIIPQYIDDKSRFFKLISKSIKYQIIGYSMLAIVAFFAFPPIISFLFPNYASAMPLFRIMLSILIPISFASVFTSIFFAYKAQANLFYAIIVKTLVTILLTPLFIYLFGLYGIGYSYFAVTLIFVLERYRILKIMIPEYRIHLKDFVTLDEYDYTIIKAITTRIKRTVRL